MSQGAISIYNTGLKLRRVEADVCFSADLQAHGAWWFVLVQGSVGLQIDESNAAHVTITPISVTYRFLLPTSLRLSNIHCELNVMN